MSTSTVNLTQLRVEAPPRELTPPPRQWTARGAVWIDETCNFRAGEQINSITSPWFDLRDDREYQFELHLALDRPVAVEFGVQDVAGRWIGKVLIDDTVRHEHILSIRDHHADRYRLVLTTVAPLPVGPDLSLGGVDVIASSSELTGRAASRANAADPNTYLPHWGFIRRTIHRACKRSRFVNTLVSAAEFRLEREELISLPQYMALCPTGQCNASCGFCSVTTNRTGIVKRELPFDRLHRFLAPVRNTIRMYGLEGNGEPTLYDHFDDLIDILAAGGATFYLITNAERLTTEQVDRVIARGVSAVNVSLNAATAATHRSVMRLKHFDRVIENVKRFTTVRSKENTTVSVSYVVNRHNIHEVVDFIRLADRELNVDHIYVRTLSEIANDQGVVEDQRDLVPHEGEVRDMLERVGDYLRLEPVRAIMHFKPETFRAFRSDPAGRIVKPPGYETRLLAPRPSGWSAEREDVQIKWSLDSVSLSAPASTIGDSVLIRSTPVPVDPSIEETFCCRAAVRSGLLNVTIMDETGREIAARSVGPSAMDLPGVIEFAVPRGVDSVRIVIGCGPAGVEADVDFERLLVPGLPIHATFQLPEPRRWEVASPGAGVAWTGPKVHLTWDGPASQYLLKSFSQPCRPNEPIALPVMLNVRRGKLGIGVLSADFTRWTHQFEFDAGTRAAILRLDPADNDRVQLVIYATTADGLDADIDWGDNITVPRQSGLWTASVKQPAPDLSPSPSASAASGLASPPISPSAPPTPSLHHRIATSLGNLLASLALVFNRNPRAAKTRYYCQKPWTDLSNFSVDGRMDVCCIATGESQKRYALGNIFEQTFQEIWNGPVAREFRRTVNHADKALPPCARCPMAYQYQGPMFDPVYTPQWVRGWLAMSSERRWLRRPIMAVGIVTYRLIHPLLFRGFRKP
ncbi:MAG: radical SAM protein [Planctomycetes bacterium]|nr:radical SAM protein [Planctomycetota bacterium]